MATRPSFIANLLQPPAGFNPGALRRQARHCPADGASHRKHTHLTLSPAFGRSRSMPRAKNVRCSRLPGAHRLHLWYGPHGTRPGTAPEQVPVCDLRSRNPTRNDVRRRVGYKMLKVLSLAFATQMWLPSKATPIGWLPTVTVLITLWLATSISLTLWLLCFETQMWLPSKVTPI